MNIPYFSTITTPEELIVICIMLLFIGITSYVVYGTTMIDSNKLPTNLETALILVISIFVSIFFFWLIIGDSVS